LAFFDESENGRIKQTKKVVADPGITPVTQEFSVLNSTNGRNLTRLPRNTEKRSADWQPALRRQTE
jgi:hypothetical protein